MSAVLINEINHAETKAKTEVISNHMFNFDQFIRGAFLKVLEKKCISRTDCYLRILNSIR